MGAGWGVDAKKGRTHQKKTLTFERRKKNQGEARPGWGRAPRCGRSPRMAWGPPAAGRPVGKCSVPVPLHHPGRTRQRARAAGQAGQGSRGRTAAFSTHTHCAIPQQRRPSVRLSVRLAARPDRHTRTQVPYARRIPGKLGTRLEGTCTS